MAPKKGKKGKKKGKKKPLVPHMKKVIQTFYELEIADLEKKIARLEGIAEENEQLEKEVEYLTENRTDDLAKQHYQLQEQTNRVEDMVEEYENLVQEHNDFLEAHHQAMLRKDCQFLRMVEDHKKDIRFKKSELVQFDTFSQNRQEMMERYQNDEKKYLERESEHKKQLEQMEINLQSYKESVKQDVDRKLLRLSEDFVGKCKATIPKHTQRLIHENIALNNELDRIYRTNLTMQERLESVQNYSHEKKQLEHENRELIIKCQKNLEKISELLREIDGFGNCNVDLINMKMIMGTMEKLVLEKIEVMKNYDLDVAQVRLAAHAVSSKRKEYKFELRLAKQQYKAFVEVRDKVDWHMQMIEDFEKPDTDPMFCVYNEKKFQNYTRAHMQEQLLNILYGATRDYDDKAQLLRVESIPSISNIYKSDNFGGFLDRAAYDPVDDDVQEKIEMEDEFPRKRRQTKRTIKEDVVEEVKEKIVQIKRAASTESVHSDIIIDVEVDDSEFFFEPSDAELSEIEEEEADEEQFDYSSSD